MPLAMAYEPFAQPHALLIPASGNAVLDSVAVLLFRAAAWEFARPDAGEVGRNRGCGRLRNMFERTAGHIFEFLGKRAGPGSDALQIDMGLDNTVPADSDIVRQMDRLFGRQTNQTVAAAREVAIGFEAAVAAAAQESQFDIERGKIRLGVRCKDGMAWSSRCVKPRLERLVEPEQEFEFRWMRGHIIARRRGWG